MSLFNLIPCVGYSEKNEDNVRIAPEGWGRRWGLLMHLGKGPGGSRARLAQQGAGWTLKVFLDRNPWAILMPLGFSTHLTILSLPLSLSVSHFFCVCGFFVVLLLS